MKCTASALAYLCLLAPHTIHVKAMAVELKRDAGARWTKELHTVHLNATATRFRAKHNPQGLRQRARAAGRTSPTERVLDGRNPYAYGEDDRRNHVPIVEDFNAHGVDDSLTLKLSHAQRWTAERKVPGPFKIRMHYTACSGERLTQTGTVRTDSALT